MSSTMDSLPTNPQSATPAIAMPSMRSMWGRLLWKDAREVVPIWLTLLVAAMLCLVVTWAMVNHRNAHIAPLYISAHTFIGLCSLITGVYLFANEDENRTLHLLRNLPLPPKQIVWQKLLLGSLGILCLACLIAAFTMLLANIANNTSPLGANSSYGFSVANILLLPLLWLVIASLSAMISRSHFYGVLIAGAITAAVIAILEPTWLGARVVDYDERGGIRWLWVTLALVGGGCVMVLKATGWVEEKVVAELPLKSSRTKTNSTGKLSSSISPNPFPVLLWQSMRQSRVLLACCFGATIAGWLAIMAWVNFNYRHDDPIDSILATQKTALTLLWMLGMMSLFASSIFLDDKRRGNFLFFQQNLERPKSFWLSRLLPFWCLALLLTLLWNFFIFDLGSNRADALLHRWNQDPREIELINSMGLQAASESFLVPLLGLLGIIGIGQYFSMFVRNPILSFVFTGIVSVVFVLLTAYVVYVNESVWCFVIPTVAAIYVAT